MAYYIGSILCDDTALSHHGIKGQKWGVRRFQNEDGSLTAAGKSRYYGVSDGGKTKESSSKQSRKEARMKKKAAKQAEIKKAAKEYKKAYDESSRLSDESSKYEAEAKELYKKLGSNMFQRVSAVRAAQNGKGTKEAKRYVKLMEKASQLQDKSDEMWDNDVQSSRKRMGKTGISRTINAMRYT